MPPSFPPSKTPSTLHAKQRQLHNPTLSRRSFLKAGIATAAGTIFFPYIARSRSDRRKQPRPAWQLIGCGSHHRWSPHAWAQSHPMSRSAAVCDVKKSQREAAPAKLKQKNPGAIGYVDYGDISSSPQRYRLPAHHRHARPTLACGDFDRCRAPGRMSMLKANGPHAGRDDRPWWRRKNATAASFKSAANSAPRQRIPRQAVDIVATAGSARSLRFTLI